MADYLPILVMAALVVAFASLSFIASGFLGPKRPNAAKQAPYECGIVPEEEPAERFPVKFYLVAMSFIVLDVEIVFLYPFATVFRGLGLYGLIIMAVFVLVLLVPFAYLLSVGALDWGPARRGVERVAGPILRTKHAVIDPNAPHPGGRDNPDDEEEVAA
ncbi:MAG: dehydrogenase subunit [Actinomycetia bacterium]|nr:dehydrogenase subunit [Actinomycetes bacterium]